jgi:hypothetical protein
MPIVNEFKGPRECVEVISPVGVDHHAAHPVLPFISDSEGKRLDGNAGQKWPRPIFP